MKNTTFKPRTKSGFGPRKKRMPAKSPRRAEKQREAKRLLLDSRGRTFEDALALCPTTKLGWDKFRSKPIVNREVIVIMRTRFLAFGECWLCHKDGFRLDPHHIFAGSRKSDELTLIVMACRACHEAVQGVIERYQDVIRAKVQCDRENTDFLRILQAYGQKPLFDSLD